MFAQCLLNGYVELVELKLQIDIDQSCCWTRSSHVFFNIENVVDLNVVFQQYIAFDCVSII